MPKNESNKVQKDFVLLDQCRFAWNSSAFVDFVSHTRIIKQKGGKKKLSPWGNNLPKNASNNWITSLCLCHSWKILRDSPHGFQTAREIVHQTRAITITTQFRWFWWHKWRSCTIAAMCVISNCHNFGAVYCHSWSATTLSKSNSCPFWVARLFPQKSYWWMPANKM